MITLFRYIFYKMKEIKYKFIFWQFVDKELTELIKNPEELEKKFITEIAKLIHENNKLNEVGKEVFDAINQKIILKD